MLVVSRKQNERVLFPNLGIAIEILRVSGKAVRVGIEAPADVRILRGELAEYDQLKSVAPRTDQDATLRHQIRNQLHTASLGLHLLQKQLDNDCHHEAQQTLAMVLDAFAQLDQLVTPSPEGTDGSSDSVRRALVVEDNANERELLAGYLRMHGYHVDTVADGVAALEYLQQEARPDIVLLDMQMPRMNGVQTLAAIRSDPRYHGIKVFAVSGEDPEEVSLPPGDQGVDRWFAKPLRPSEFASQLGAELNCVSA